MWVELANKRALSGLTYMGPVDSEGMIRPKATGNSPLPQGKCLEDCIKKYPGRGARGDSISNFGNLSKPDTGRPPVISGEGICENKIITGARHKKWLVDRFRQLHTGGSYKGIVWLGVCKNNGPEDNLAMLSNEGRRVPQGEGAPGRSTVIYMPCGADPTAELEIIYWFHGGLGFRNGTKEWQDLWDNSLKEMSRRKRTLGGARRKVFLDAKRKPTKDPPHLQRRPRIKTDNGPPGASMVCPFILMERRTPVKFHILINQPAANWPPAPSRAV